MISPSPTDLQRVLDTIAEAAARLCTGDDAVIGGVDGDEQATIGAQRVGARAWIWHAARPSRVRVRADARSWSGATMHVPDNEAPASRTSSPSRLASAPLRQSRTVLTAPLLREGEPIGAGRLRRREPGPFTDRQIALLETFADQAVIAIENARLFTELQESNRDSSTEALEQQTATAEVLGRSAARRPTCRRCSTPIADSAARLCGTDRALISASRATPTASVAGHRPTAGGTWRRGAWCPLAARPRHVAGRAIADGAVVHLPDLAAVPGTELPAPRSARRGCAPCWRCRCSGRARRSARSPSPRGRCAPFTDRQIALLETFADQAVIAIENARLFQELQDRRSDALGGPAARRWAR